MRVVGAPIVPGQFWLKAIVKDRSGKMQGRTAHTLIYALSALDAAQSPIVETIKERLEKDLPEGEFQIEFIFTPARGQGCNDGEE